MRTAWASAGDCKALSMAAVDEEADESMRWLAWTRPLASSARRWSCRRDDDDAGGGGVSGGAMRNKGIGFGCSALGRIDLRV